ncbi:hypothetical protein [Paenibacillus alba]|uniref:Lipoprotein n=1 Tax=Paenibacillus alba TaxID=1197127 RepID=A0ABU6G5Z8_9BACL|nr:hypothetical protein [Paenibacillus alba]MEC0229366.1 hypothetical protein [Paenibacillus alba]
MRKKAQIILTFCILFILMGCSVNQEKDNQVINHKEIAEDLKIKATYEKKYIDLLKTELLKKEDISAVHIFYNDITNDGAFTGFSYRIGDKLFIGSSYGIAYNPNPIVYKIETRVNDFNDPLTFQFMNDKLKTNPPRDYQVIVGYINDESIKSIQLNYKNGIKEVVNIENNMFMSVKIANPDSLMSITSPHDDSKVFLLIER